MRSIPFECIRTRHLHLFSFIEVDGDEGVVRVREDEYDLWEAIKSMEEN